MSTNHKVHVLIPARYASTRLPGKPLLDLNGKPMFWHVWQRASSCPSVSSVTIATDNEQILESALSLNVPCVMTSENHQSGTDRIHEAVGILNLPSDSIILNVQGDEPALEPLALSELISAFDDKNVRVATLATELSSEQVSDVNRVKVVCDLQGDALYFSRSQIPYNRSNTSASKILGHIGIYGFKAEALARFVSLPQGYLEQLEQLEQLRFLENKISIRIIKTKHKFHGIDTKEDIKDVLSMILKS